MGIFKRCGFKKSPSWEKDFLNDWRKPRNFRSCVRATATARGVFLAHVMYCEVEIAWSLSETNSSSVVFEDRAEFLRLAAAQLVEISPPVCVSSAIFLAASACVVCSSSRARSAYWMGRGLVIPYELLSLPSRASDFSFLTIAETLRKFGHQTAFAGHRG